LYDGKRLLRNDRYDAVKEKTKLSDEELASSGVLRIHPSFRIMALAEPPVVGTLIYEFSHKIRINLYLNFQTNSISCLFKLIYETK